MPTWYVRIHGSGIQVPLLDIPVAGSAEGDCAIGFYATRVVVAADAGEAAARGLQRMAQEWSSGVYAATGATPSLAVDAVDRVPWWRRFRGPRAGAAFYSGE
jgi:hypothetical protein